MSGRAHGVAPVQGSFIYPTRNFAQVIPMSPWGPDHIFTSPSTYPEMYDGRSTLPSC